MSIPERLKDNPAFSPDIATDTLSYVTEGMDCSLLDSLDSNNLEEFGLDNLEDDEFGRDPFVTDSDQDDGPTRSPTQPSETPPPSSAPADPPVVSGGGGLNLSFLPEGSGTPTVASAPAPAPALVGLYLGHPARGGEVQERRRLGGLADGDVGRDTASIDSSYTSDGGLQAEIERGDGLAASVDELSGGKVFTSSSGGEEEQAEHNFVRNCSYEDLLPEGEARESSPHKEANTFSKKIRGESASDSGNISSELGAPLEPYARPSGVPPKSKAEIARHKKEHEKMKKLLEKKARDDAKEAEERKRRTVERDRRISESIQTWREDILPKWEKCKGKKKVKQLSWLGIPPAIRNDVWPRAFGNPLNVSPELFDINRERAREKAEAAERVQNDPALQSTTPAGGDRKNKENSVALIALDLPRTFPALTIFGDGAPMNHALRDVLEAYVCYRPDVGYGQGMSYVAAMLLLYMEPYDAFVSMASLLNKPIFLSFYRVDLSEIHEYLRVYEHFFEDKLPKLYRRFQELSINSDVYMIDWVLTLFTKALPLDVAAHVWDNYLFEGDLFIFRTALGILHMYSKDLLSPSVDFGDIMVFLTHLPKDIDETALFKSIEAVPLSVKKYDQLLAKEVAARA